MTERVASDLDTSRVGSDNRVLLADLGRGEPISQLSHADGRSSRRRRRDLPLPQALNHLAHPFPLDGEAAAP